MEAVSRGAHEAGGHVIGVTMTQFKAEPNPYVKKIMPSADFYSRLQELILKSAGYVAMRGGIGTLTEVSLVWNKLMTGALIERPLILLGDCWPGAISSLREHLVVSDNDVTHLRFAKTVQEAVSILVGSHPIDYGADRNGKESI
jgi:predicted Rossmann-fold nucleotide-binding protein